MTVSVERIDRQIAFILEKSSPEISNEIMKNDGILAIFGLNDRIKIQPGGDVFEHQIEKSKNSNTGWRGRFSQIDTNQQDNWRTPKYPQAVLDGAVVFNLIEKAQNSSTWKKHDLIVSSIQNAVNTITLELADGLRAATPGENEPESIQTIIEDNAVGSQTNSTGGLTRNTTYWFNQYNNTDADLSAQAGIKTLEAFYWQSVAKGPNKKNQPDFGLVSGTRYATLSAFANGNRRWTGNADMEKLGFDNIKILNMTVIADPSIDDDKFYMINTNHMYIQLLQMSDAPMVTNSKMAEPQFPNTIPITWGPLQLDIDSPNYVKMFFITMNLTTNSLQRQGIMSALS